MTSGQSGHAHGPPSPWLILRAAAAAYSTAPPETQEIFKQFVETLFTPRTYTTTDDFAQQHLQDQQARASGRTIEQIVERLNIESLDRSQQQLIGINPGVQVPPLQWRPNILEPSVRSQRDGSCGNPVPTGIDEFNDGSSGGGTPLRHGSSKCNGERATQYARPVRRGLVHGSDEGDIKMLGPEQGEHQLVTHNELPRSVFHIEHPTGAPGDGARGGKTNRGTTSGSFSPPLVPPPPIGLQTEPENTAHCVPPLRIALNDIITALHASKANLAMAPGGETGGWR